MLQDGEKGVILQRDKETYAVAPHVPCGVITPETLRRLADVAEKYNVSAMKLTSSARIALVGIKEEDVEALWEDLAMEQGAGTGLCVRSIKACPGTVFCRMGQQDSLSMGMALDKKYHGLETPNKFKIGVSGCPNQCAETCIKEIGLVGMKSGWRLFVGGNGGVKPRLSQELTRDLSDDEALALTDRIITWYKEHAEGKKRLGAVIESYGFEEFKKDTVG